MLQQGPFGIKLCPLRPLDASLSKHCDMTFDWRTTCLPNGQVALGFMPTH